MIRGAPWLLSLWLMLGCGRDITARQLEEPCTRTSQCDVGLECLTGVCRVQPDAGAGPDGGP